MEVNRLKRTHAVNSDLTRYLQGHSMSSPAPSAGRPKIYLGHRSQALRMVTSRSSCHRSQPRPSWLKYYSMRFKHHSMANMRQQVNAACFVCSVQSRDLLFCNLALDRHSAWQDMALVSLGIAQLVGERGLEWRSNITYASPRYASYCYISYLKPTLPLEPNIRAFSIDGS